MKVCQSKDHQTTGRWMVHWKNHQSGLEQQELFDAVYICTGHHGHKSIPDDKLLHGYEEFKGEICHSHDVKNVDKFRNKRVVVVGLGNSGADLAAELASIANQVRLILIE